MKYIVSFTLTTNAWWYRLFRIFIHGEWQLKRESPVDRIHLQSRIAEVIEGEFDDEKLYSKRLNETP